MKRVWRRRGIVGDSEGEEGSKKVETRQSERVPTKQGKAPQHSANPDRKKRK